MSNRKGSKSIMTRNRQNIPIKYETYQDATNYDFYKIKSRSKKEGMTFVPVHKIECEKRKIRELISKIPKFKITPVQPSNVILKVMTKFCLEKKLTNIDKEVKNEIEKFDNNQKAYANSIRSSKKGCFSKKNSSPNISTKFFSKKALQILNNLILTYEKPIQNHDFKLNGIMLRPDEEVFRILKQLRKYQSKRPLSTRINNKKQLINSIIEMRKNRKDKITFTTEINNQKCNEDYHTYLSNSLKASKDQFIKSLYDSFLKNQKKNNLNKKNSKSVWIN